MVNLDRWHLGVWPNPKVSDVDTCTDALPMCCTIGLLNTRWYMCVDYFREG